MSAYAKKKRGCKGGCFIKALIFSDSHGNPRPMLKAWALHKNDTDALFFLGDGYKDLPALCLPPELPLYQVKGNNDFFSKAPLRQVVEFDSHKILLTHGDHYYVKSTTAHLEAAALAAGAEVALFGHTHFPYLQYLNEDLTQAAPLYLFNPGSIGLPPNGRPAYGILETYQGKLILMHATVF